MAGAELAEGFTLLHHGDAPGAYELASSYLRRNDKWPAAHFLAGNSCVGMRGTCTFEVARRHLELAAVKNGGGGEPPLPPAMRAAALRLWLSVASQEGIEGKVEFSAVAGRARKLDPDHGPTLLLWASWVPRHPDNSSASETGWSNYEARMLAILDEQPLKGVRTLVPGSIDIEDPLVAAAYSSMFNHAYLEPQVRREPLIPAMYF